MATQHLILCESSVEFTRKVRRQFYPLISEQEENDDLVEDEVGPHIYVLSATSVYEHDEVSMKSL